MNEPTLTGLKIIVERAVRPVRASTARKRKMREELLAHVGGVFAEESSRLGDDRAALEQTALRFGNSAEVTSQMQAAVPAGDRIWRLWEGPPDASTLRGALQFALIESVIILSASAGVMCVAGYGQSWSRQELIALVSSAVFLPFWLMSPLVFVGIALLAHAMEKPLLGPTRQAGWPRIGWKKFIRSAWSFPMVKGALVVGGLSLLTLLGFGIANLPTWAIDWNEMKILPAAIPFASMIAAFSVLCAWFLVQAVAERRRYHAEWSSLPLEPSSAG